MAFDPTDAYKHELTYTTLSHIKKKTKLCFFDLCKQRTFKQIERLIFKCICYKQMHIGLLVPTPSTLRNTHILIYSFDTRSLLHKNDIFFDYNLKYNSYIMFKGNIFQPIFVDYCIIQWHYKTFKLKCTSAKWYHDTIWQLHTLVIT